MRGSKTHQKGRETQVTSSVRERSYTNKKEALVLKRQPRASLANFLSQHLTFQSVLAFLDVDPKKYTEQGTLLSAQFSSWKRVPKSSSSPGTETGPRFWLSSSKIQAHAIRGPKLELRLGTHFWGPIMPVFFSSRSHICLHSWSLCSKVNKTLRSSVLLHHAGVPLKLKVVSGTRGNSRGAPVAVPCSC